MFWAGDPEIQPEAGKFAPGVLCTGYRSSSGTISLSQTSPESVSDNICSSQYSPTEGRTAILLSDSCKVI